MKMLARYSRKAALITAAAGMVLAFGSTSPAHAADGNDPYVSGCASGAYAVGSATILVGSPNTTGNTGFGSLHLMYSPHCNTNWAEFDNYPRGYRFVLVGWSHNDHNTIDWRQELWTSNGDEVAWTDMVDGTYPAGVGVCEDSSSGAVLKTAFMSQAAGPIWDGPDSFTCYPSQNWYIQYYP
jgi:Protein of unknown function (DUF2690)